MKFRLNPYPSPADLAAVALRSRWPLPALIGLLLALPVGAAPMRGHSARPPSDYAYVFNSGTASLPGYRIFVGSDGRLRSVTLMRGGRTTGGRRGTLTPPVTRRFFQDLSLAFATASVTAAGTGSEASYGRTVRITVRYHGQETGDLRQARVSAESTLLQDIKQIAQVLRLPIPDTP